MIRKSGWGGGLAIECLNFDKKDLHHSRFKMVSELNFIFLLPLCMKFSILYSVNMPVKNDRPGLTKIW